MRLTTLYSASSSVNMPDHLLSHLRGRQKGNLTTDTVSTSKAGNSANQHYLKMQLKLQDETEKKP